MSNAPILLARDIHKSYGSGHTEVKVLRGVDIDVAEGEFLAIVGASGSGKSTLLHILGALDLPTSGEVLYKGDSLSKMGNGRRDAIRNRTFGFVFQFYHLLGEFSALENVLMPAMIREGIFSWPGRKSAARKRATELLTRFGLGERLRHKPSQLSGGEQQRVAIARALILEPEVLLCDEPTGNLDSKTGREIMDMILGLNKGGQTIIAVTHDRNLAGMAHREVSLADGRIKATRKQAV